MRLATLMRSGLAGGLADQAVVSLGNFGLNILLARQLNEHGYGVFSLILSMALLLNALHQALITFPLSVDAAPAEPGRLPYLLCVASLLTFIVAAIFVVPMAGAALGAGQPALAPLACLYLLAWQLQEVWRRGLLARARYGAALANDAMRYLAPLLLLALWSRDAPLSLQGVFALLFLLSLAMAAGLLPSMLREFPAAKAALAAEIRRHWKLAAPLLLANLLAAFSNQWFLWLLAAGHDVASAGALVAVTNIVAFSQPLMFGLENVMVPEIARRREGLSFGALRALLARRLLAAFALTVPVFVAVLIWPEAILRLVYGTGKSYGQYAPALRLMALAYMTYLAGFSLSATLRGYRRAGDVLRMNFYSALLGVTFGSWLIFRDGVTGACLAALLCGSLRVIIGCYFVNRLRELTVPEHDEIVAA